MCDENKIIVEYDDNKHFIGKLCRYNHKYLGGANTIRYKSSSRCVTCGRLHASKYYKDNIDCMKKYRSKWQNGVGRDNHLNSSRKYQHSERGKIQSRHDVVVRRKRIAENGGKTTQAEIRDIIAKFGGKCVYCGDLYEDTDHIVAISNGGTSDKSNLVPACARCNSDKYNKIFEEWYIIQDFYSIERENKINKHRQSI